PSPLPNLRLFLLAQSEALQLARLSTRQRLTKLDGARIFVRRDGLLDEILQRLDHDRVASLSGLQDDKRLDDMPALLVRQADDRALRNRRMLQQRIFDFGA